MTSCMAETGYGLIMTGYDWLGLLATTTGYDLMSMISYDQLSMTPGSRQ